jgi:hypothetical protein
MNQPYQTSEAIFGVMGYMHQLLLLFVLIWKRWVEHRRIQNVSERGISPRLQFSHE